jgi:lysine 2,3-aminomutase
MELCDWYSPSLCERYARLVEEEGLLPVRAPPFYLKKIEEEIRRAGRGGPLYRAVFPTEERLSCVEADEPRDYIGEFSALPVEGAPYILRKYENRLAFLVTEECFGHCQYCFRTYKLSVDKNASQKNAPPSLEEKTAVLKKYLALHPQIREIILTGGDPLCLEDGALAFLCGALAAWDLRLHTRAIVYEAPRITEALIALFSRYKIRLVFHIIHPYEICEAVEERIAALSASGVRLYAQFPLLRGINDHYQVLAALFEKLDTLGVRPLSVFIVEPNKFSGAFRLPFARIERLINAIHWNTPSWMNALRFTLDTSIGKVRREDIVQRKDGEIIFERAGRRTAYRDFPAALDTPPDPALLLWKDAAAQSVPDAPPPGKRAGNGAPDAPLPGQRAGNGVPDAPLPGQRAGEGAPPTQSANMKTGQGAGASMKTGQVAGASMKTGRVAGG